MRLIRNPEANETACLPAYMIKGKYLEFLSLVSRMPHTFYEIKVLYEIFNA